MVLATTKYSNPSAHLNPFIAQENVIAAAGPVLGKNGCKLKKFPGDQAFHLNYGSFKGNQKVVGFIVCNHELYK